jgi:hypothetical protein
MYMYSWDMRIWCPGSLWCNSLLPIRQQGAFFFYVKRTKRLWHDCSSSSSPSNKTWTRCESINLNYVPSGRNSGCHISLLCGEVGREKKSGKFWCGTGIVCTRKNILPNHGIVWEAIKQFRKSLSWSWTLYKLGMNSWLGRLAFWISKLGLQWFKFILWSLNLSSMGLKHLPLVNIVLLPLNILIKITLGGESMSGRLRCLGFWLRGSRRC